MLLIGAFLGGCLVGWLSSWMLGELLIVRHFGRDQRIDIEKLDRRQQWTKDGHY